MTDTTATGGPGFHVGAVLSRGFTTYFRNIVTFVVFTVIAFIPGGVVMVIAAATGGISTVALVLAVIGAILLLGGWCWLSAGVTYGVIADLRGRRAGLGELLGGSLRSVPALIGLLLIGVGVVAVYVLLAMIPMVGVLFAIALPFLGIYLYVLFWMVVPAIVAERIGPVEGLRRSASLSKGARWKVFAVLVIWFIISIVVGIVLNLIFGIPAVATGHGAGGASMVTTAIEGNWVEHIVNLLIAGIGAALAAVGYHDLRVSKEGVGTEEIARVFD